MAFCKTLRGKKGVAKNLGDYFNFSLRGWRREYCELPLRYSLYKQKVSSEGFASHRLGGGKKVKKRLLSGIGGGGGSWERCPFFLGGIQERLSYAN